MIRVVRQRDWYAPVRPAPREVRSSLAAESKCPPIVLAGRPAGFFAEHWLDRAAERGYSCHAVTPRPGRFTGTREQAHDIVQVAASLPRQAVLIGHGPGARWVAAALTRYPARAAALIEPPGSLPAEPVTGRVPVLVAGTSGRALTRASEHYGVSPTLLGDARRLREPGWLYPLEGILDWLDSLNL